MKILVFSDSHQRNDHICTAVKMHTSVGNVDCIFHLGDGVRDLDGISPLIPVCYVDGNYEEYITNYIGRKTLKSETVVKLGGFKFFLTHGHKYGVKGDLSHLISAARQNCADVVVFGHTHERYYEYIPPSNENERGLYVFNPGSISRPRDNRFSYGIIEIRDKNILISHASVM